MFDKKDYVVACFVLPVGCTADSVTYTIFYRVQCALFFIKNYAEIFPAHYTWKVADKGFKMVFMMNKLAMIKF